ncbi:MAG: NAD-binding protein [Myxococcales bacterium]|nr:NAD-binding protein [Myxococcales bacterium]
MRNRRARFLLAIACVPVVLVLTALGYMVLMEALEGEPRTFMQSLAWASETLTTTGYGRDAEWTHPALVAYVIVVQIAGLLAVFSLFPLFLLPFLEDRFESRIPNRLPPVRGDLVIYGYGPSVASLLVEARASGLSTIVVEPDEHQARVAVEAGHRVVHLRFSEATQDIRALKSASAIVANAGDDEDAALLVEARAAGFAGPLIALVDSPSHRDAMVLAGASMAFTSRHALAAELAAHVSARIRPRIIGAERLGLDATLVEMRVAQDSELAGRTVRDARVRQRTGASLLAVFKRGVFTPVIADTVLPARARVLAVGSKAALTSLGELLVPITHSGVTLVIGDGDVARRTRDILRDVGEPVRWLAEDPAAELSGDPLDPVFMATVGVPELAFVVLALENDARTLLALAVLRSISTKVRIIAGVDRRENEDRTVRVGADLSASLAAIAGRVLLFHVTGEMPDDTPALTLEVLAFERDRVISLREASLPKGALIVAIRRADGTNEVDIGADTRIEPGDALVVCRGAARRR